MANKRNWNRETAQKSINCNCGSTAKLSSRRNFPFGRNSTSITRRYYKCQGCKKITPL